MKRGKDKFGKLEFYEGDKVISGRVKCWPYIFCVKEQKVVAICNSPVKIGVDKSGKCVVLDKVTAEHWTGDKCEWVGGERYKIDMSTLKPGDKVLCSHCNGEVDFRLFPSTNKPTLITLPEK